MKKIFGITLGGLQQKIFNLCIIFLLLIIGLYTLAASYQSKHLEKTISKANSEMQTAISSVSSGTMEEVARGFLVQSSENEAQIIDEMFNSVVTDVSTLQIAAEEFFANADTIAPLPLDSLPDYVRICHEKGLDPSGSDKLGMAANMVKLMDTIYEASDGADSCFIGIADGMLLMINKEADVDFKEFPVRERPWYVGAADTGEIFFTDVEDDAFTGRKGVVCSAPVYCDGELVAVVGVDVFLDSISETVEESADKGGFLCIVNEDGKVIFSPRTSGVLRLTSTEEAQDLRKAEDPELAAFINDAFVQNTDIRTISVDGVETFAVGVPLETLGWTIISAVPVEIMNTSTRELLAQYDAMVEEANQSTEVAVSNSMRVTLICTGVILLMAVVFSLLLAKKIVAPLTAMTKRMSELKEGDIQFRMEDCYRTGDEIEVLAESFADLSEKTVRYISEITRVTAEKERLGAELDVATQIQADMLPRIFPPYPEKKEFDIYATMNPAKEVGGDFYDFFLIDDNRLAMVMADVSGKGIPAALFMVIAKTLIKNRAQMGGTPAEMLRDVNDQLCEGNDAEMFVTAWLAVLDLNTGEGASVNAGHEYPALKRRGKTFELVKRKHSPAVAMIPGMKFRENQFKLEPGDCLFVYTDGVPEATNENLKMFGTERMLKVLDKYADKPLEEMLAGVKAGVEGFVGETPQFDDMTMLALRYHGKQTPSASADDKQN